VAIPGACAPGFMLPPASRARCFIVAIPGACAPGFMLSPASRARCFYYCDPWGLRLRLYAVARFAGSVLLLLRSLAPQALCCRPLRGLGAFIVAIPGACAP